DMRECKFDLIAPYYPGFKNRPRARDLLAISLRACDQRQAAPDFLLIARMDAVDIPDIDGKRHACICHYAKHAQLGIAQGGPVSGWPLVAGTIVRNLRII